MKRLGLFGKREAPATAGPSSDLAGPGGDVTDSEALAQQDGANNTANTRGSRLGAFAHRLPHPGAHTAPSLMWSSGPSSAMSSAQVFSMIGWLCGSGQDDWEAALRLCDDISTSTDLSKEAARALRKEIEHGTPQTQECAARLMVICSRNAGDRFRLQLAQKKFLDVIEKVLKTNKTAESVKAMLHKALSVLAYEHRGDRDLAPLVGLYNKVKRPEDSYNGNELDAEDPIFSPAAMPRQHRTRRSARQPEDFKTLAQTAKSNAAMLSEALSFTSPEDMDSNELIQEFYLKCQESQSLLVDAMPLAAQKAQAARPARQSHETLHEEERAPTSEDTIMSDLETSNAELSAVFKMYDDMQRKRREEAEEREARHRSMQDTRYNRAPIPYEGVWASSSSENLQTEGNARRNSAQSEQSTNRSEQNIMQKTTVIATPPLVHQRPSPPASPPQFTNPYMRQAASPVEQQLTELDTALPVKATNPFARQTLPAGAAYATSSVRNGVAGDLPAATPQTNGAANEFGRSEAGSALVEEPDTFEMPTATNPYAMAKLPPRSPSAGFNPYTSTHHVRYSSGSNASIRTGSTNPYTGMMGGSPARLDMNGVDDDELVTPVEPSTKALGKLRRLSIRDDDAADDPHQRQQVLETQLRDKYKTHAEKKSHSADL